MIFAIGALAACVIAACEPGQLTITTLTASSIDVSPDGQTLAIDVLGDIYLMPVEGGPARLLVGDLAWDSEPRFSPDGKSIAFASDRQGYRNLWIADLASARLTPISHEGGQGVTQPAWQGNSTITGLKANVPADYPNLSPGRAYSYAYPAFSVFGASVGFQRDGWRTAPGDHRTDGTHQNIVQISDGKVLESGIEAARPHISPDGTSLAYIKLEKGVASLWIRKLGSASEVKLTDLGYNFEALIGTEHQANIDGYVRSVPDFGFGPDGSIFAVVDGRPSHINPDTGLVSPVPFQLQLAVPSRLVPFRHSLVNAEARQLRWPAFTQDQATFIAVGDVWLQSEGETAPERLTSDGKLHYSPVVSPDGRRIVFSSWSDDDGAELIIRDLEPGTEYVGLRSTSPIMNMAWAPDGRNIAFIELGTPLHFQPRAATIAVLNLATLDRTTLIDLDDLDRGALIRPASPLSYADDGRSLYYQTAHLEDAVGRIKSLRKIDIQTGVSQTVLSLSPIEAERCGLGHVDHFVPSGGMMLGVVDRTGLWAAPMATFQGCAEGLSVRPFRVSEGGASYAQWVTATELAYSYASSIHRVSVQPDAVVPISEQRVVVPIPHVSGGTIAFINGRILTMNPENEIIDGGSVVVRDGRIVSILSHDQSVPADMTRVDLGGRTIMPGLIDVHSDSFFNTREAVTQRGDLGEDLLKGGITTMFAPSGRSTTDAIGRAELVEAGRVYGPRLFTTGVHIQSMFTTDEYASTASPEEARTIVDVQADNGAILIKSYSGRTREQRRWLIQAAAARGLSTTIDISANLESRMAHLLDGGLSLEHGFGVSPLRDDVVLYAGAAGAFITPTVVDSGILDGGRALFTSPLKDEFDVFAAARQRPEDRASIPTSVATYFPFLQMNDYAHLAENGVHISIGRHGGGPLGFVQEVALLELSGMTPEQVLRSSTIEGARKLGLDGDLGSIEVGKVADLIVLNGDPLDDLRVLLDVRQTYLSGRLVSDDGETVFRPANN